MSFLEKIPHIYKRLNETSTQDAIDNMQPILKRIIADQKFDIYEYDLRQIKNKMHLVTFCEKGLENEDFNAKPENKHLFGSKAVDYLFWKLVHTANEDNTGCNARQLYEFLKQRPEILISALKGVFCDKDTIGESKKLQKDGKYMQDCYTRILQNIEKSLNSV